MMLMLVFLLPFILFMFFSNRSQRKKQSDMEGKLKKGDLVLLCSVGAGFTVGAVLLRWSL